MDILALLQAPENEKTEFKEAKNDFDFEKLVKLRCTPLVGQFS